MIPSYLPLLQAVFNRNNCEQWRIEDLPESSAPEEKTLQQFTFCPLLGDQNKVIFHPK